MQLKHYLIRFCEIINSNIKLYVLVPLVVYWVIILVLTSLPSTEFVPVLRLGDKFEHFIAYMGLGSILFFALHFQKRFPKLKKYIFISSLSICYLYGIFDEIHQIFIPGRSFDWFDVIANYLGSFIGIFLIYKYINFIKNNTMK